MRVNGGGKREREREKEKERKREREREEVGSERESAEIILYSCWRFSRAGAHCPVTER